MTENDKREEFTVSQAARYYNVTFQTIHLAIRQNRLKAYKKAPEGTLKKSRWMIRKEDLDEYRSQKYIREKKTVNGERLFDIEKDRWSVLLASLHLTHVLKKPYPRLKIYHLIRTGRLKASKYGGSYILKKEDLYDLYCKEIGHNPNQGDLFANAP